MQVYALAQLGDRVALHVFVRREDAWQALDEASADEPDWVGMPFVAPIELDERRVSAN